LLTVFLFVWLRADPPGQGAPGDRLEALWRGQPCDLSRAEFLVLVSCTVGRLSQESLRDVDGFCIELVLSQARSVLAARWPIHCWQAPRFANAVIRRYLELRGKHTLTSETCLRARAVNLARRECFAANRADPASWPEVGLNTAAAFELYGLG
jgi:hypothetical protein